MKPHYDIAVIGAGPAGMAAATSAAAGGASVVLLDEQPAAGGQIYRNVGGQNLRDKQVLGPDYYQGLGLVEQLGTSAVEHVTGASVWQVSAGREVGVTKDGVAHLLHADQIIIATGAMERPFPIPGWTLPGVMGAGAAQVLLKSSGVAMANAVFVGTGPLLYLVAHQYLLAGAPIRAILDTTPRSNMVRALPHLGGAMGQLGMLIKGQGWIRQLRGAGVAFIRGVRDVRCFGADGVEGVEYRKGAGWNRVETSHVFLHQGVVPNTNLAVAAGCQHVWNDAQKCWHAQTDDWCESDISGIAIAGDGVAIGGAVAARQSGHIAALGALWRGGFIRPQQRDELARPARRTLAREIRVRPFLDAMFEPQADHRNPPDNATIVCRCEEVTAGQVRDAVRQGCRDANQLKSHTRCGMGPCQGRQCGLTASAIIARETNTPMAELAQARQRPVVKPLSLDALANMAPTAKGGG